MSVVGQWTVPYNRPTIGEEEIEEVADTLRSGWLTTGAKTMRFEEEFAKYVGCKHALAVSSCTAGLQLVLAGYGIGPGDEVLVPAITFPATAAVVMHQGATPVLVDVDSHLQMSVHDAERKVTSRTKAIMPIHHGGQACDLRKLDVIANDADVPLIEDAAHAPGCEYDGRKIGAGGTAVFSFYATKNMTTGDGGMIVTDDDRLSERLRPLTCHGITHDAWSRYATGAWSYSVIEPGFKASMNDVAASIGIHQLKRLDGFMARRREIAERYHAKLRTLTNCLLPEDLPGRPHGYHLYALQLPRGVDRDKFVTAMKQAGIGTSVHFVPLYLHPAFAELGSPQEFALTQRTFEGLVSLPCYPAMTDDEVDYVLNQMWTALLVLRH